MGLWVVVFQVLALTCLFQSSRGQSLSVPWATWGGDLFNTRHIQESLIGVQNVARLNRTWQIQSGAVSATPTIASDGLIYVPDFLGFLYCIDSATGAVVFKINIVQMIRNANIVQNPRPWLAYNVSRTSPAIDGDFIYFGTQLSALVACANRFTGAIKWVRQVSTHDVAIITASPVVYNGVLFVGLASNEEHVAGIPSYECCSTIGAFLAYNASTGDLLWRFDTLPPNGGASNLYAGGGVWGSTSPIDPSRNAVYLPTGNTFRNPKHIDDCYANITFVPTHINNWTVDPCLEPNNYAQSIISLDITTGQLKWFKSIGPLMAWSLACGYASNPDLFNPVNCPQEPPGDNADWASAPMFIKGSPYTPQNKDVLVAPQKNGFVWAFDPDNGDPFWVKSMGPGGIFGGSMWGTATDGRVGYFAQSGASGLRYTLPDGTNITRGSWFAMRISDGAILWITPVPFADNLRLQAIGPVTVANGVVYAYVNNPQGTLVAMNAATGAILWKYDTGARGSGGVSIYNGGVFVGAGWVLGSVSQGSINAFSLDGKPLNIATTGSTGSTGSARSTGTSRTTGSSGTAGGRRAFCLRAKTGGFVGILDFGPLDRRANLYRGDRWQTLFPTPTKTLFPTPIFWTAGTFPQECCLFPGTQVHGSCGTKGSLCCVRVDARPCGPMRTAWDRCVPRAPVQFRAFRERKRASGRGHIKLRANDSRSRSASFVEIRYCFAGYSRTHRANRRVGGGDGTNSGVDGISRTVSVHGDTGHIADAHWRRF
eukprot:TRINITY_DN518_c0_g1_i8.p1 TRINITY_DN518_c0_g1~~TRINITY_DN518_c0_g1_i8.p1  ORF type:complete len:767 (+),score=70.06 TRINITY_DN518_c0_g1_i8:94-2394(+)